MYYLKNLIINKIKNILFVKNHYYQTYIVILKYISLLDIKKTKPFTLSDVKIRFSDINFDDMLSSDCLEVKFNGITVPIKYVK